MEDPEDALRELKRQAAFGGYTPEQQILNLIERTKSSEDVLKKLEPLFELIPLVKQLTEALEERRRAKWIWKKIGVFLVGLPTAAAAMYQLGKVLVEWIRGQ